MQVNLAQLFLLSFLGSVVALIGGVFFLFNKRWSQVLEKHSIPFAAGVLITVSLVGLTPEAFELIGTQSLLVILVSFAAAYIFEHMFFGIHHHADEHGHKHGISSSIPLIIFGDTIHNFIDGVAMGASFLISPGLGIISAFSTFLHEFPHEIGDFGILLKAGWKKKNILVVNIISAAFAILGSFSVLLFSENNVLIGLLLSVSAGIFFYLGTVDFLPRAGDGFSNKMAAFLPFIFGIVIMLLTLNLVPHSH